MLDPIGVMLLLVDEAIVVDSLGVLLVDEATVVDAVGVLLVDEATVVDAVVDVSGGKHPILEISLQQSPMV